MSSSRRIRAIAIDQLLPGMYVVKLDIPWIDSPFIKHTRIIKNSSEVAMLQKAGVKMLVVDLEKGVHPESPSKKTPVSNLEADEIRSASSFEQKSTSKPNIDTPVQALEREMHKARLIRSQIQTAVSQLNARLDSNQTVSLEELQPLIDETVESLERNNQALLNLVHLSRKSQKLVDHSFSVFCLALNVAVTQGLPEEDRSALGLAALLHDSGWLQLPLNLMGKRSHYTPTEQRLVCSHLDIGLKMLGATTLSERGLRLVREHHERCDGSGYPAGLKGRQLHPAAKILAVVDSYDECIHQLTDKPGMLPTNALRLLYKEAEQGKFDPEVVAAFISLLGIYPVTSAVRLDTGEKAVVEQVFADAHLEPIIRVFYDSKNKVLADPFVIDLREGNDPKRKITELIEPGDPKDDFERKLFSVFE